MTQTEFAANLAIFPAKRPFAGNLTGDRFAADFDHSQRVIDPVGLRKI
jgi:hypothetical protein